MILVTTSRSPTQLLRKLSNDLARTIPGVVRVNRGKLSIDGVEEQASVCGADRVMIIEKQGGNPSTVRLYRLEHGSLTPHPPVIHLKGVLTQDQIGRRTRHLKRVGLSVADGATPEALRLVEELALFLGLQVADRDTAKLRFDATLHICDKRISMTSPPITGEVGPVLHVRDLTW